MKKKIGMLVKVEQKDCPVAYGEIEGVVTKANATSYMVEGIEATVSDDEISKVYREAKERKSAPKVKAAPKKKAKAQSNGGLSIHPGND